MLFSLRDDRRAFGDERRQTAGVIRVRMRVHHVTNRLARDQLLGLRDVRERARLALPGFEHHHVIAELDDQRVVAARTGGEAIEAVTQLLRRDVERAAAAAPEAGPPVDSRETGASAARSDGFALRRATSTSKNGQPPRVCTIVAGAMRAPPKSFQPSTWRGRACRP